MATSQSPPPSEVDAGAAAAMAAAAAATAAALRSAAARGARCGELSTPHLFPLLTFPLSFLFSYFPPLSSSNMTEKKSSPVHFNPSPPPLELTAVPSLRYALALHDVKLLELALALVTPPPPPPPPTKAARPRASPSSADVDVGDIDAAMRLACGVVSEQTSKRASERASAPPRHRTLDGFFNINLCGCPKISASPAP